jgi:hypothetical protein
MSSSVRMASINSNLKMLTGSVHSDLDSDRQQESRAVNDG